MPVHRGAKDAEAVGPNSKAPAAQVTGGTVDPPVPRGDSPHGTGGNVRLYWCGNREINARSLPSASGPTTQAGRLSYPFPLRNSGLIVATVLSTFQQLPHPR